MKLHNALKDRRMKYPRLANRLLDLAMALIIVGGLALCAVALKIIQAEGCFWLSSGVFLAGMVVYAASSLIAGIKNTGVDVDSDGPRLKLVK